MQIIFDIFIWLWLVVMSLVVLRVFLHTKANRVLIDNKTTSQEVLARYEQQYGHGEAVE